MDNEFREDSPASSGDGKETGRTPKTEIQEKGALSRWAEMLLQMGLGESMLRVGTSVISLVVIAVVVWLVQGYLSRPSDGQINAVAAQGPTPTPAVAIGEVVPVAVDVGYEGIPRMALPYTTIPSRPRQELTKNWRPGPNTTGVARRPSTHL